jgi:hypothetical protein
MLIRACTLTNSWSRSSHRTLKTSRVIDKVLNVDFLSFPIYWVLTELIPFDEQRKIAISTA